MVDWLGDLVTGLPTGGIGAIINEATGGGAGDAIGSAVQDFSNVGKNKFTANPYGPVDTPQLGVSPQDAWGQMSNNAQDIGQSRGASDWAIGQMHGAQSRGPQAWEDQGLSNQEAGSRGYQSDALGLAQNAAYGNAPSVAAYQMQHGLDQALAQQQALAGGARGSAALATAQGNMGANAANLQQNAFMGAGMLRAQEMAQARDQYGNLATGQRGQDQARLGQGNQMAQFNAGLNDQYGLGMGQLGVGYGNLTNSQQGQNQGYFNTGVGIAGQQAGLQGATNQLNSDNYNNSQAINAGVSQANADESGRMRDRWLSLGSTALQIPGGMGGTKPNPS